LGADFTHFDRRTLKELSKVSFPLERLVSELLVLNDDIKEFDKRIADELQKNEYAKLLNTIPGVGIISAD